MWDSTLPHLKPDWSWVPLVVRVELVQLWFCSAMATWPCPLHSGHSQEQPFPCAGQQPCQCQKDFFTEQNLPGWFVGQRLPGFSQHPRQSFADP